MLKLKLIFAIFFGSLLNFSTAAVAEGALPLSFTTSVPASVSFARLNIRKVGVPDYYETLVVPAQQSSISRVLYFSKEVAEYQIDIWTSGSPVVIQGYVGMKFLKTMAVRTDQSQAQIYKLDLRDKILVMTGRDLAVNPDYSVPSQTLDSSWTMVVNNSPDATMIFLDVRLDSSPEYSQQIKIPTQGSFLTQKIYLNHGQGNYKISVWQSKSLDPNPDSSGYEYIKTWQVKNLDQRDMSYLLPSGDVQSDNPEIQKVSQMITAGLDSEAAKALAIHDWVAQNIAYDTEAYFSGNYKARGFDALAALHNRKSICYGYAGLYAALARAAGLRTKIVDGQIIWLAQGDSWSHPSSGEDHAWNEVQVEGRWVPLDVTWDAGYVNFTTQQFSFKLHHDYFDPAADNFAKDHRKSKDDLQD